MIVVAGAINEEVQPLEFCGVRTDLALETHDALRAQTGGEIPGVAVRRESFNQGQVTVVEILNDQGSQAMGKPKGTYVTLEAPAIREANPQAYNTIVEVLAKHLTAMIDIPQQAGVLVVGLGNWNATPDALGPKVAGYILVTRHLFEFAPQAVQPGMRPVSAVAPGVLGITGLETAEVIQGIVEKTKPSLVIVIDALAAGSVERIGSSIQVANTGINPGSGIGNKRRGLTQETLGVPVISIGVPTVVHAALIAREAIYKLYQAYQKQTPTQKDLEPIIGDLLKPFGGALMVTPKEIDDLIQNCGKIIAGALTKALHRGVVDQEYISYLH